MRLIKKVTYKFYKVWLEIEWKSINHWTIVKSVMAVSMLNW